MTLFPCTCTGFQLQMGTTCMGCAANKEVAAERDRCVELIRHYLLFDSQRAVSWHEVQDCIAAIREGKQP